MGSRPLRTAYAVSLRAIALVGLIAFGASRLASPAAAVTNSISWLAAGDSYSSGQGLTYTTKPCARGSFEPGSLAYPVLAYNDLRKAMPDLSAPTFTACTGATTSNFFDHGDRAKTPEWYKAMGRFDLVTFTFGGDDIGFRKILEQCLYIGKVAASAPKHSCPSDTWVRSQITKKLTTDYQAFLLDVANSAVVSGGNIVVLGYPELVDLPKFWPPVWRHAGLCQGLGTGDAIQLRGDAGDLNATIAEDVKTVNSLPAPERHGVHLTFLDVNTGGTAGSLVVKDSDENLFEPSSGGRHNLCGTGVAWINGVSPSTLTHSFHPNELGNAAEARLLAELLPTLTFNIAPVAEATSTTTTPPNTSFVMTATLGRTEGPPGLGTSVTNISCPTADPGDTMWVTAQAGNTEDVAQEWDATYPMVVWSWSYSYPAGETTTVTQTLACREAPTDTPLTSDYVFNEPVLAEMSFNQTIVGPVPQVTMSPSSAAIGQQIMISGGSCGAYLGHTQSAVAAILPQTAYFLDPNYSSGWYLKFNIPVDSTGNWSPFTATIPSDVKPGQYTVAVTCLSDDDSAVYERSSYIDITAE